MRKSLKCAVFAAAAALFAAASARAAVQIGIPDDATNGARAIKLLETAGLITVDPAVGFAPELKDVTAYLYDVEIVPTQANTLPATLDDYAASTINGTYAVPAGLLPSRDALLVEKSERGQENPFVNVIAARSAEKDKETFKKIVSAYQTQTVAEYILAKYHEAYYPAFDYKQDFTPDSGLVSAVDEYRSSREGKEVVKVGVCGSSNAQWNAVQKVLDERGDKIYIELVEFDAYNLPNEALNSGEVDLNAFQHKAFLKKEAGSQEYQIEAIGDTIIAPLSLYSRKVKTLDELKTLAGKK
ncbi:MAG: MetQ/NlpA family ABC transporter substrate-binding protein [Pyramidobacter sp.]